MTWHEQAHVEDHSPYTGGAYATHLIIAGIVNPDHDFELYVHRTELAKRCHTSVATLRRQLDQMVDDGWLEVVEGGGGRGNIARYRFVKKGAQSEQVSNGKVLNARSQTCSNPNPVNSVSKEEQKAGRRRPETPFPEGSFFITAAMSEWAKREDFDYLDLRFETGKFKDHALANERRARDWVAAWRNWIRNASKFSPKSAPDTNLGYDPESGRMVTA